MVTSASQVLGQKRKATGGRIVVGIDFGTTYSGIAYVHEAYAEDPSKYQVIVNWEGGNGSTSEKTPSKLLYGEDGKPPAWGYLVEYDATALECFKLLLDPGHKFPAFVDQKALQDLLTKLGKSPVEVVGEYLQAIGKTSADHIRKACNLDVAGDAEIDYVMTVPAIWSDAAKAATKQAAELAGIDQGQIQLISEPEAAAIHAMHDMKDLTGGDIYIICDAGGGTVDLITYEVTGVMPLRLAEVTPGTGDLCGSSFVNEGFRNLLRAKLGKNNFAKLAKEYPGALSGAMKEIEEYIKPNFVPMTPSKGQAEKEWGIPLVGAPTLGSNMVKGKIFATTSEVRKLFTPLIERIIELITDQLKAVRKAKKQACGVILVGGFGQSKFLHAQIEKHFRKRKPDDDQVPFAVIQARHAWTAIVRGAVMYGASKVVQIESRRARYHYGFKTDPLFIRGVHQTIDKYWDELDATDRAEGQMSWIVKRGQTMYNGRPVLFPISRVHEKGQGPDMLTEELWSCSNEIPPMAASNPEIKQHCFIEVPRSKIPENKWVIELSADGKEYETLEYELGMHLESGRLKFEVRIGKESFGMVDATFE